MAAATSPESIFALIEQFVAASRRPALIEGGDEPLPLVAPNFAIAVANGRVTLQAWNETRNTSRRILAIEAERPGRLDLRIERFGKRTGTLTLVDLDRPARADPLRMGARLEFREQFRRFLSRQFPAWKLAELSTEPDLQHSLSPAFPRALIRRGATAWAAIAAAGNGPAHPDGALSFGLVWLDYLRTREPSLTVEGLALFLPAGFERTTCLRLHCLNPKAARYDVFAVSENGFEDRLDPADHGNLDTRLEPAPGIRGLLADTWSARLAAEPFVEAIDAPGGSVSFRVRGLEFARLEGAGLRYGIDSKRAARDHQGGEVLALARHLDQVRHPSAPGSILYERSPEAWLESQVRRHLPAIDAELVPAPIYGQVPQFTAGDRGAIDLLAAGRTGRLAVIELKASADLHLPLQALDYWTRVRRHVAAGDFTKCGYFPEIPLSAEPPRLLLIAPALEFHPTTEKILRFFSPEVEVERIGLGAHWRREAGVMFRVRGARKPGY